MQEINNKLDLYDDTGFQRVKAHMVILQMFSAIKWTYHF